MRSAGLALGSVVGYLDSAAGHAVAIVGPAYVDSMIDLFRERFENNQARIARFEEEVRKTMVGSPSSRVRARPKEMRAKKQGIVEDSDRAQARRAWRQEQSEIQNDELFPIDVRGGHGRRESTYIG